MNYKYLLISVILSTMIVLLLGLHWYWIILIVASPLIYEFPTSIADSYKVRDNHFFMHSKYNDES